MPSAYQLIVDAAHDSGAVQRMLAAEYAHTVKDPASAEAECAGQLGVAEAIIQRLAFELQQSQKHTRHATSTLQTAVDWAHHHLEEGHYQDAAEVFDRVHESTLVLHRELLSGEPLSYFQDEFEASQPWGDDEGYERDCEDAA